MGSEMCIRDRSGTFYVGPDVTFPVGASYVTVAYTMILTLAPGDYMELCAFQDTGGNLNANGGVNNTWASLIKVSK